MSIKILTITISLCPLLLYTSVSNMTKSYLLLQPRSRRSPNNRRDGSVSPPSFRNRRSPSPEGFSGFGSDFSGFGGPKKLDSSNKGHQMMQKMGWKGTGLGSEESGIVDPIEVSQ